MNRLKAAVLAAAITLSGMSVHAVEIDTDDKQVNKAVEVLAALNILTDYSNRAFKAETLITRGECAAMMVRILLGDELASGIDSNNLENLPADWRTGYIASAVQLGIINGNEKGEYAIEEAVTYNQAVKMIVSVLGYGHFAESAGGYPDGYLGYAARLQFARGITTNGENPIARGEFVRMLYNALEVDICKLDAVGTSMNYKIIPGRNLVTEHLRIIKQEGKVYANYLASLTDPTYDGCGASNVIIDERLFEIGETLADKYLGYKVEYYFRETNGLGTLVYVSPAKHVSEVTLVSDDIDKANSTTEQLTVYVDGSNRPFKISQNADVLYNGKPDPLYTVEELSPETGYVKLIDNNGDNAYDTVIIESYDTYMADSVSALTKRINFSFPNGTPVGAINGITTDEKDVRLEVFDSAGLIKYESIKKHDVLSVACAKPNTGKPYIKIVVSSERVNGVATEITSNDTAAECAINGEYRKLNSRYADLIAETVILGRTYTYYIDIFGNIAFIDKSDPTDESETTKYGYLVGIEKGNMTDAFSMKLFDSSGVMQTFETTKRIAFDNMGAGPSAVSAKVAFDVLVDENDKPIPQLLQYGTDAEGKISQIKTAMNINDDLNLADSNKFTVNSDSYTNLRFLDNTHFGLRFFMDTDTVVMIVPSPENIGDDKAFAVGANLLTQQDYFDVKAYNLNQMSAADLIVVQTVAGDVAPGSMTNLYIVEKITKAVDDDGMERKKIYLNSNGSLIEYLVAEACLDSPAKEAEFNKIQPGDAVQLTTNSRMEVSSIVCRFDVSEWTANSPNTMESYYDMGGGIIIFGTGTVKKADGNFVSLEMDATPAGQTLNRVTGYFISYTRYYLVEKVPNGVSVKTIRKTDLTEGMKMMFFRYYQSFREIVIYEGF